MGEKILGSDCFILHGRQFVMLLNAAGGREETRVLELIFLIQQIELLVNNTSVTL